MNIFYLGTLTATPDAPITTTYCSSITKIPPNININILLNTMKLLSLNIDQYIIIRPSNNIKTTTRYGINYNSKWSHQLKQPKDYFLC